MTSTRYKKQFNTDIKLKVTVNRVVNGYTSKPSKLHAGLAVITIGGQLHV